VHRRKIGGTITVEYLSEYLGTDLHIWEQGKVNPENNVICTSRNIPLRAESSRRAAQTWEISGEEGEWSGPCSSVLRNIVVFPDLSVQICCGIALNDIPELTIGSLRESDLVTILKNGNHDLIANWLALEGPSSILEFVRSKKPDINLPDRYVGRCHLCNELFMNSEARRVLAEYAEERREGLLMMRGALDWITDDWPASSDESLHCAQPPHELCERRVEETPLA
jgi:hypothetical protein